MPYIPNLIERINLLKLYPDSHGVPVMTVCPSHGDSLRHPNLAVYPQNTYCYSGNCDFSEGALQHIERRLTEDAKIGGKPLPTKRDVFRIVHKILEDEPVHFDTLPLPPLDKNLPVWYHNRMQLEKRRYIQKRYGFTDETIEAAMLGHTSNSAYTLPVYDSAGQLITVRFRRDDEVTTEGEKYWALRGRGRTTLYLPPGLRGTGSVADIVGRRYSQPAVFLTEGEFDALALSQEEIPAVSFTNGAKALLEGGQDKLGSLQGLSVFVAYDQDEPGRVSGSKVVSLLNERGIQAGLVSWPRELGKDASELVAGGMKRQDFMTHWHVVQ
jgi:hypothetical protein